MKGKNYREFRRYGAQCDAHCRQPQHQKSRRLPHHFPFWISTSTSHPHPALYKPPPRFHLEADQISDSKLGGEIIDIMQNLSMTREPSRVPMG